MSGGAAGLDLRAWFPDEKERRIVPRRRLRLDGALSVHPLAAGASLAGRYEIRAVISRRPTGLLYHGYDRQIGVEVALRVIDDELLVSDDERRAFLQRAGRARSLQHP